VATGPDRLGSLGTSLANVMNGICAIYARKKPLGHFFVGKKNHIGDDRETNTKGEIFKHCTSAKRVDAPLSEPKGKLYSPDKNYNDEKRKGKKKRGIAAETPICRALNV